MADLQVQIRAAQSQVQLGQSIVVEYDIENVTGQDLHVVRDRVIISKVSDTELKMVLGLGPLGVDIDYRHFNAPDTQVVAAGQTISGSASAEIPFEHSEIDSNDRLNITMVSNTGEVDLSLDVGYGLVAFTPVTADTLGEFSSWQNIATSNTVRITISPP